MQTSRAYVLTNIILRQEIFENWQNFYNHLHKGAKHMQKYLYKLWHSIDEKTLNNEIPLIDINREVKVDDFKIFMELVNNIPIFFFVFPEPEVVMRQAKCVALSLSTKAPRYFTMELFGNYSGNYKYEIGEWVVEDLNYVHTEHGELKENTLEEFVSKIKAIIKGN